MRTKLMNRIELNGIGWDGMGWDGMELNGMAWNRIEYRFKFRRKDKIDVKLGLQVAGYEYHSCGGQLQLRTDRRKQMDRQTDRQTYGLTDEEMDGGTEERELRLYFYLRSITF